MRDFTNYTQYPSIPNSVRSSHIFCPHSLRFFQNYREYPSLSFQIQTFFSLYSILSPPFPFYFTFIPFFYFTVNCLLLFYNYFHFLSLSFNLNLLSTSGWSPLKFCSFIILTRFSASIVAR